MWQLLPPGEKCPRETRRDASRASAYDYAGHRFERHHGTTRALVERGSQWRVHGAE
jgi:hypothetical protein